MNNSEREMEKIELYKMRYYAGVMADLQLVPFGVEQFNGENNFFAQEIKRTGIDITEMVL